MIYSVVESSLSALGPGREGKLGTRNGTELELALSLEKCLLILKIMCKRDAENTILNT